MVWCDVPSRVSVCFAIAYAASALFDPAETG